MTAAELHTLTVLLTRATVEAHRNGLPLAIERAFSDANQFVNRLPKDDPA